jgi:hypothetical protein
VKFLCLDCDEPMKLLQSEGPDRGSLTVTFRCSACGVRVAMLTNPFETQLVRSLGVAVGGRTDPPRPFEHLRASMAHPTEIDGTLPAERKEGGGSGCPFAAMVTGQEAEAPAPVRWSPDAETRAERIPPFIRPMAKKAIERFAQGKGYTTITEAVMDEARAILGF